MSDATNRYCSTAGNCYGAQKTVGPEDVITYDLKAKGVTRTAVSLYVKNPKAQTQLTMTSEQVGKMLLAERAAIEADLGLVLSAVSEESSDLPLYYWVITLAIVIVLFGAVGAFVCCVHYRTKKRDAKRPVDDVEMRSYHNNNTEHHPDMSRLKSVKRPTVDIGTNVYQADIIAETKTVFLRPPKKNTTPDDKSELYAVVRKSTMEEKQQKEQKRKREEQQQQKDEKAKPQDPHPYSSPNIMVVTAEISSSNNEGSSHLEDNDDAAGPSSGGPQPPTYHQAIGVENNAEVRKEAESGVCGPSEMPPTPPSEDNLPPPPSEDNLPPPASEEDLPPPPPPDVESDSASSSSQELPPPPDEFKATEDSARDPKSSPPRPRWDSHASSSPSSGKASSSAVKDVDEAVGDLENLIADQSKEIADQGLHNPAIDTVINEDGEPTTEL